jgi:hypothetical protein
MLVDLYNVVIQFNLFHIITELAMCILHIQLRWPVVLKAVDACGLYWVMSVMVFYSMFM